MMSLRESGGCIGRASSVQAYVLVSDTAGMWLEISKPQARQLVDAAREAGEEHVDCEMVGNVCRLGAEHTIEDDEEANEPGPICSGCGAEWDNLHRCPS
jgi:hypothetical protein